MGTGERSNHTFDEHDPAPDQDVPVESDLRTAGLEHSTVQPPQEPFRWPSTAGEVAQVPLSVTGEAEFDSIEEVDAVARSVRRVAIEYGLAFLALLLAVAVLSKLSPWWFARPLWGGFTLNFLAMIAFLYVAFIVIGIAYARFADHIEDEMLGRPGETTSELDAEEGLTPPRRGVCDA